MQADGFLDAAALELGQVFKADGSNAAKAEVVHLVLGLQDPLAVIGLAAVRHGHVIGFVNVSAHQLLATSTNTLSTLPSLPFGKVNTSLSSRSWYR